MKIPINNLKALAARASVCAMLVLLCTPMAWGQTYTSYTATGGSKTDSYEGYAMLVDNNKSTKWYEDFSSGSTPYVEFKSDTPIAPIGYVLTTGGDTGSYPDRNPTGWVIKGRADETSGWTTLATVSGDSILPAANTTDCRFLVETGGVYYQYFRFEVTSSVGNQSFQLAELQFLTSSILSLAATVTFSEVIVNWEDILGNSSWTLQCGTDPEFVQGTYHEMQVATKPTATLTGLTHGKQYYARVKATGQSHWSDIITFDPGFPTFTVYEGADGSDCVPVEGYCCDNYLKCEFVMPAGDLTTMKDYVVKSMTFYLSEPADDNWNGTNFKVFLKEVEDSTISAFSGTDGATVVYEGALDGTGNTMTVNFTTPYEYLGGNLLVGFYNTATGNYSDAKFKGKTVSGASVQSSDGESLDNIDADQKDFLPMTTFGLVSLDLKRPVGLTATTSGDSPTSAVLSWTDREEGVTTWQVAYSTQEGFDPDKEGTIVNATSNPFTLTGLTTDTTYYAYVRAVKDSLCSQWSNIVSFAPGVNRPVGLTATTSSDSPTSAVLSWTDREEGVTAWQVAYSTQENFDPDTEGTKVNATSNPFTLTGLTTGTTYYACVRAVKGSLYSLWTDKVSFAPGIQLLTVYEGTVNKDCVPVEGWYCNSYQKCEFVMPAGDLKDMEDCSVRSMTFYLSEPASESWSGANFKVFLKEVEDSTISEYSGTDGATVVYEGPLDGTGTTMTVNFTTTYDYAGGNLLVGFYNTATGNDSEAKFKGKTVKGASIQGSNGDSLDYISANQKNFLPMTTFRYSPIPVKRPVGLTATTSGDSPTSAVLSWTDREEGVTAWQVAYSTQEDFAPDTEGTIVDATSNPFTLTGLTTGTTYYAYVRAVKDNLCSQWTGKVSFAPGVNRPVGLTATTSGDSPTSAVLSWTDREEGVTAWQVAYSTQEGFDPDTKGTIVDATSNPFTLTGLTTGTTYYACVRAVKNNLCSQWSDKVSFAPGVQYLTVCEGTAESECVPVEGDWCDSYQKCEFVIPASYLTAIKNNAFKSMTFYLAQPASESWGETNFKVFLKEVEDSTISDYYGTDGATFVYEGPLDGTDSTMTVNFTKPYDYAGGNLLVGFYNTVAANNCEATFKGQTVEGASVQGNSFNGLNDIDAEQRDFLPMTTFGYFLPGLKRPVGLTATTSDDSPTSAVLSWTDREEGVTAWQVAYSTQEGFDPDTKGTIVDATSNPFTLTGLTIGTTYYACVRAVKDSLCSMWTNKVSFATGVQHLTVCEGTTDNDCVPVNGEYCDCYQKCEFVMPAGDLKDMKDHLIKSMTFYLSQPATYSWGDASFKVFLKEVEASTISDYYGTDGATFVYEGPLDGTDSTMTVYFTKPYDYAGGNLLVGFYNTVAGDFSYAKFKGKTVEGASVQGYTWDSQDDIDADQKDFLPMTTFTFYIDALTLADNGLSNAEAISSAAGNTTNVVLDGRTLHKDGKWNTLCLPFSMTEQQVAEQLAPDTLMTLGATSYSEGTLTLNFVSATTIEAGKPYIVKWNSGTDIVYPIFYNVTISDVTANFTSDYVDFIGITSPKTLTAGDKSALYLDGNTLRHPAANMSIGSCRAYFQLSDDIAPASMGDVNGDGKISVADVTGVINHVLGKASDNFITANADANGDGIISVDDVMVMVKMVLQDDHNSIKIVVNGTNSISYGAAASS